MVQSQTPAGVSHSKQSDVRGNQALAVARAAGAEAAERRGGAGGPAHLRRQHVRVDRVGEDVIGPGIQPCLHQPGVLRRREDEDGQLGGGAARRSERVSAAPSPSGRREATTSAWLPSRQQLADPGPRVREQHAHPVREEARLEGRGARRVGSASTTVYEAVSPSTSSVTSAARASRAVAGSLLSSRSSTSACDAASGVGEAVPAASISATAAPSASAARLARAAAPRPGCRRR